MPKGYAFSNELIPIKESLSFVGIFLSYFLLKYAAKGLYFVPSSSFRGRASATRRSERTAGCRSPRGLNRFSPCTAGAPPLVFTATVLPSFVFTVIFFTAVFCFAVSFPCTPLSLFLLSEIRRRALCGFPLHRRRPGADLPRPAQSHHGYRHSWLPTLTRPRWR
mgnify:CR=1 FL=1